MELTTEWIFVDGNEIEKKKEKEKTIGWMANVERQT